MRESASRSSRCPESSTSGTRIPRRRARRERARLACGIRGPLEQDLQERVAPRARRTRTRLRFSTVTPDGVTRSAARRRVECARRCARTRCQSSSTASRASRQLKRSATARASAGDGAESRRVLERAKCRREVFLADEAAHAGLEQLGGAVARRGGDGDARGHGFEADVRERVVARRQHEQVRGGVELRDVASDAEEVDAPADPERVGLAPERARVARARDDQIRLHARGRESRDRAVEALAREAAADEERDRTVESELAAHARAARARARAGGSARDRRRCRSPRGARPPRRSARRARRRRASSCRAASVARPGRPLPRSPAACGGAARTGGSRAGCAYTLSM